MKVCTCRRCRLGNQLCRKVGTAGRRPAGGRGDQGGDLWMEVKEEIKLLGVGEDDAEGRRLGGG